MAHLNQFRWRRTSWKSTVLFTQNTNRNQDEWAGLANHTDYTDPASEHWPEPFGALSGSWAGGGLALAGAAGPPASGATRRLVFPVGNDGERGGWIKKCSQEKNQKRVGGGGGVIGYRSNCIRHEQAVSPDKSGGCGMKAEQWMLECTSQKLCVLSPLTGGRVSSVVWPALSVFLCSGAEAQPAGHAWPAPPPPSSPWSPLRGTPDTQSRGI